MIWHQLKTDYSGDHPVLLMQYEADGPWLTFCADSWCTGGCGHSALVTNGAEGQELKAHGDMVAVGPVFAPWRVTWLGSRVSLRDACRDAALRRYWL
jgi:hypothetical protein